MAKKITNRFLLIFRIFWDGIVIYCKHLDNFLKYMFFPIFGQILGLLLIFTANYFFIVNIPNLIKKYPILDNIPLVFTLLIICVFPGFLVFCKAFYDYIVAYGSLNSMVYVSRGGKMKNKPLDTKTHDDILKKRLAKFIGLWLIIAIGATIGLFPLFIIPFGVLCVYLCLIFQVFMLEESVSLVGVFKRSFNLIKGNFAMTFMLIAFSFALTYVLIPGLFIWIFEKTEIIKYLIYPVQSYLNILPIKAITDSLLASLSTAMAGNIPIAFNIESAVNVNKLAENIVSLIISLVATGMLLPLRCAWFTLLYKTFDSEKTEELRKTDYKRG